jgi:hypothetical protein
LAVLLACNLASEAVGQAAARGRVGRLRETDTVPAAGLRVLLHRVATGKQGPIDSVVTDALGRFLFRFRPDSGALYLTSAQYAGIEYFSAPLLLAPEQPDTGVVITVADSSSTAPVSVVARHLVITRPGTDGARNVLDMTMLRNLGPRTRIAPDTIRPSWSARLPAGTQDLDVGQGDFSPEAVIRRHDSVLVFGPIAPGEKQLTVDYHLPPVRRTLAVGFDEPVPTINLLLEEPDARVSGFARATVDTQHVEARTFRRWSGSVAAGDTIRITLSGQSREASERWILIGLVSFVGAVLVAAAWRYKLLGRS